MHKYTMSSERARLQGLTFAILQDPGEKSMRIGRSLQVRRFFCIPPLPAWFLFPRRVRRVLRVGVSPLASPLIPPPVIRHGLQRRPEPVVVNDHLVHPKDRGGPCDLSGELGLQLARLGVRDDAPRYGDRDGRVVCPLRGHFGRVRHDPSETVLRAIVIAVAAE